MGGGGGQKIGILGGGTPKKIGKRGGGYGGKIWAGVGELSPGGRGSRPPCPPPQEQLFTVENGRCCPCMVDIPCADLYKQNIY